ncbi:MAG: PKD domain-containing protein, partial [Chlorobi bacterium]|nr:PKD domain-containing protein [Chlorobiota bacterium]
MQSALAGPRLPITTSNGGVAVSGVPICAFRADSLSILYGQSVHFYDLSAGIPAGWQWTFTGGTPPSSVLQNPTVTYSTPGLYTVKLRVTNSSGNDSLTKVNYIRVRGAALNSFNIVSPPSLTRITVSASDTSNVHFIWTKSSANPTVTYKIKLRKLGTQTDYSFVSNSAGIDSVASIRKSALDTLASIMGTTGDSVRCTWRALAYNGIDSLQSSNSFIITLVRSTIGIQVISTEVPAKFALYNNYPNPFNPVTKIKFDVPSLSAAKGLLVKLIIYDILGRETAVLVNQNLKAGKYEADWDASDYPSGIYFYSISAGDYNETRKMVLVK